MHHKRLKQNINFVVKANMIRWKFFIFLGLFFVSGGRFLKAGNLPDSLVIVRNINISGNKITKPYIILRELSFREGDTLFVPDMPSIVERCEDNLMNTGLFNFATLSTTRELDYIDVLIDVTERWYIWPIPIFEHADRNFPAWLRDPEFKKLNYGIQVNWNNFRGRRELIEAKLRLGYKEQYALMYAIPNIGKRQQHGISFGVNKFRQHEVIFRTADNKPQYLTNEDHYTYETLTPSISYSWRPGLYFSGNAFLTWSRVTFRDDAYHEDFLGIPPGNDLRWFGFGCWADLDYRDYKVYPLKGYLLSLRFLQQGIGLERSFKYDKTYITLIAAIHREILPRFYFGDAFKVRLSKNEYLPYYFREGIGYNTYLRGFEYYIIDGNSYFVSVNNLKYALIPGFKYHLPWLHMDQFNKIPMSLYANIYFDCGMVRGLDDSYNNDLVNEFLYSTGIGIDLVTYYDQVYRLEFTLNSLGEAGIFLHLETPFFRW
jgi:outer membrane protein assembly factor BamA